VEQYIVFKTFGSIKERTQTSTERGIGCQRNGYWLATDHLSGRGLCSQSRSCRLWCAGRGCALIGQLATSFPLFFLSLCASSYNLYMSVYFFVICPIAIAYSMGQIIKSVCVCVCVCLSVHLRALSRSHFLIDFHKNWHRRKNPEK